MVIGVKWFDGVDVVLWGLGVGLISVSLFGHGVGDVGLLFHLFGDWVGDVGWWSWCCDSRDCGGLRAVVELA